MKFLSEDLKEWIRDIAAAILIAVIILQFIQPTVVREHSMEPGLIENDYLFVSKKSYKWFGEPQHGDIIVFKSTLTSANGKEKQLIKRIIGIPGDTIYITGGVVYRNDEALDEPYIKDGYTLTEMGEVTVPEGSLFCMGDNRQNSADSRDSRIGMVSMDTVVGKAIFRLFPFSKIGKLN